MRKGVVWTAAAACVLAALAARTARAGAADGWRVDSPYAKIVGDMLVVDVPPGHEAEAPMAHKEVPLAAFTGKAIEFSVSCAGEGVSAPDTPWYGLKAMIHYKDAATGRDMWPQAARKSGTFASQILSFRHEMEGRTAEKGEIALGLQQASGRVLFDLSTVTLAVAEPLFPRVNPGWRVLYPARVRNLKVRRGVMLPAEPPTREDFAALKAWGATLARYQMCRGWGRANDNQDLDEYDRWVDGKIDTLLEIIPWAREAGVMLVVDLHVPPGGRDESNDMNMFYDARYAEHFVEVWKRIAARVKGRPEIFGLDLINEPVQTRRALPDCDYWNLQRRAAEAVRSVDPEATIIMESNGWDSPDAFAYLSPLAMDNVIYQFHMYTPHQFTHQGVGGAWNKSVYPDPARGWDKAFLRAAIRPVLDFQRRHGCRVYVGEFSAIAWAEGADRYLADCIQLFEENGFDWTYHAFREWQGWSVEHECDGPDKPFRASGDNARKRALIDGLHRH